MKINKIVPQISGIPVLGAFYLSHGSVTNSPILGENTYLSHIPLKLGKFVTDICHTQKVYLSQVIY